MVRVIVRENIMEEEVKQQGEGLVKEVGFKTRVKDRWISRVVKQKRKK